MAEPMTEHLPAAPTDPTDLAAAASATIEMPRGQALLVAQFADMDQAMAAHDALREAERVGSLDVIGVLVIRADAQGKVHIQTMTEHTTRRGLRWGVVAGAALGLIFPPSILVGAAVAGVAGALTGKAYSLAKKDAIADELAAVIPPESSGLVAIVAIEAANAVRATIPQAVLIRSTPVDAETAEALAALAQASNDDRAP